MHSYIQNLHHPTYNKYEDLKLFGKKKKKPLVFFVNLSLRKINMDKIYIKHSMYKSTQREKAKSLNKTNITLFHYCIETTENLSIVKITCPRSKGQYGPLKYPSFTVKACKLFLNCFIHNFKYSLCMC